MPPTIPPAAFWSAWSEYSHCSLTCLNKEATDENGDYLPGTKTRTRTCSVSGACKGQDTQLKQCLPTIECPCKAI